MEKNMVAPEYLVPYQNLAPPAPLSIQLSLIVRPPLIFWNLAPNVIFCFSPLSFCQGVRSMTTDI